MKMKTMKKVSTLKKNIQRFGSLGIRLVLLNNLSHFWSQRNNVFYKNELNKIEYINKYLTHKIKINMFTHINNTVKNTIDSSSISVDDNIAKKHSMKNPIENKLFLTKKYKKNIFKSELNYNLNLIEIPNFVVDTSSNGEITANFLEDLDFDTSVENYKFVIYNEYYVTYNLIKNIFDNTKK